MSLQTTLCALGCLICGHAPTVEINEPENRSELVCERCRTVLGVFVMNLRKDRIAPATRTRFDGFQGDGVVLLHR